ncbi:hypothetical protein [Nocardia sp. SC052]
MNRFRLFMPHVALPEAVEQGRGCNGIWLPTDDTARGHGIQ